MGMAIHTQTNHMDHSIRRTIRLPFGTGILHGHRRGRGHYEIQTCLGHLLGLCYGLTSISSVLEGIESIVGQVDGT